MTRHPLDIDQPKRAREREETIYSISARARVDQARSARRRDEYNERRARRLMVFFWVTVGIIDALAMALILMLAID